MKEIVTVVSRIVYLQKIEENNRLVPVGLVDLVSENKLGGFGCSLFPFFSRFVLDHLGECPHRLHSSKEGSVLARWGTVPCGIGELLGEKPTHRLPNPIILRISCLREGPGHVARVADVRLEPFLISRTDGKPAGLNIVKFQKVVYSIRKSRILRRYFKVR